MNPGKKRRRWLKKRRREGLARPRPLRRAQCNAQGVTAKPRKSARIVRRASRQTDVLTMCEVANIDVAKVLGREWDVAQDTSSWAKAGSAVAVRKSRGHIKKWKLSLKVTAFLRGRRADRMQNRYAVKATARIDPGTKYRWTYRVAAAHGPPKRNWFPWWNVWVSGIKAMNVHDIGADWNREARGVRRYMGNRKIRMKGIDGFAVRKWIPMTKVSKRNVGSDHPLVEGTIWQRKKKK